ncbi:MAG: hypothetical protein U0132_13910 [Gemmatimonadaceae bacterium]
MAVGYSYEATDNLVVIEGSGVVTLEDRFDCIRTIVNDPELPHRFQVLVLASNIEQAPPAGDLPHMSALVDRLRQRSRSRIAILNATVGHFTLSQLVALLSSDGPRMVQAFSSEAAARTWLTE